MDVNDGFAPVDPALIAALPPAPPPSPRERVLDDPRFKGAGDGWRDFRHNIDERDRVRTMRAMVDEAVEAQAILRAEGYEPGPFRREMEQEPMTLNWRLALRFTVPLRRADGTVSTPGERGIVR